MFRGFRNMGERAWFRHEVDVLEDARLENRETMGHPIYGFNSHVLAES